MVELGYIHVYVNDVVTETFERFSSMHACTRTMERCYSTEGSYSEQVINNEKLTTKILVEN